MSSGSSSDAQIFKPKQVEESIDNGTLGLLPPKSLGRGPDLHYFLLGDDAFALMRWMVIPYSKKQLTREERIANCRREGSGKCVWNISDQIQGTTGHNEAKT